MFRAVGHAIEKEQSPNLAMTYLSLCDCISGIFRNVVEVAVKTLKTGSSVNPDDFRMEAETMHILRHPRLVQLMGVCADADGQSAYIITERMQNGDLLQHLKMDNGELIKYQDLIEMATQVFTEAVLAS